MLSRTSHGVGAYVGMSPPSPMINTISRLCGQLTSQQVTIRLSPPFFRYQNPSPSPNPPQRLRLDKECNCFKVITGQSYHLIYTKVLLPRLPLPASVIPILRFLSKKAKKSPLNQGFFHLPIFLSVTRMVYSTTGAFFPVWAFLRCGFYATFQSR